MESDGKCLERTHALEMLNIKAWAVEANCGGRFWSEVLLEPPLDKEAALGLDARVDVFLDGLHKSGQRRNHHPGIGGNVLDDVDGP